MCCKFFSFSFYPRMILIKLSIGFLSSILHCLFSISQHWLEYWISLRLLYIVKYWKRLGWWHGLLRAMPNLHKIHNTASFQTIFAMKCRDLSLITIYLFDLSCSINILISAPFIHVYFTFEKWLMKIRFRILNF